MNINILLVIAIIVVSWVIFIFNFVLGYYIGRAMEAAEQRTKKKSESDEDDPALEHYVPSSTFGKPAVS